MKALGILLVLLAMVSPALGQDCDEGRPCGAVPWRLPSWPRLASPTPMPTIVATVILTPTPSVTPTPTATGPTPTPGPSATPSPAPTATSAIDLSGMNDQIATLGALQSGTQPAVANAQGTPMSQTELFADLGSDAGLIFGYARGIGDISLGKLSPLFWFVLTTFSLILLVKISTFLLPLLAAAFGLFRELLRLVLEFLPL